MNTDAPLNYLLDPIRDRLDGGDDIDLLSLALAAWLRRVRGVDEAGRTIDVKHPLAALLRERAEAGGTDPRPLLSITSLFGDLAGSAVLVATVERHLHALYERGAAASVRAACPV